MRHSLRKLVTTEDESTPPGAQQLCHTTMRALFAPSTLKRLAGIPRRLAWDEEEVLRLMIELQIRIEQERQLEFRRADLFGSSADEAPSDMPRSSWPLSRVAYTETKSCNGSSDLKCHTVETVGPHSDSCDFGQAEFACKSQALNHPDSQGYQPTQSDLKNLDLIRRIQSISSSTNRDISVHLVPRGSQTSSTYPAPCPAHLDDVAEEAKATMIEQLFLELSESIQQSLSTKAKNFPGWQNENELKRSVSRMPEKGHGLGIRTRSQSDASSHRSRRVLPCENELNLWHDVPLPLITSPWADDDKPGRMHSSTKSRFIENMQIDLHTPTDACGSVECTESPLMKCTSQPGRQMSLTHKKNDFLKYVATRFPAAAQ